MKRIKLNIISILRNTQKIASILFGLVAIFLSFVNWEDIGIHSMVVKIIILLTILIIAFIFALLYILLIKRSNTIWQQGTGEIRIIYGDIIWRIFDSKKKNKGKIFVIPVNTCFDTIVDKNIATVVKPIVSANSLHGKWVQKMLELGVSLDDLDSRISNNLAKRKIPALYAIDNTVKTRGKLESFPKGTISVVEGPRDATFFLLALGEFDDNNNAQCDLDEFYNVLKSLITFFNSYGQGYELYVPLMGTNLSRVGLSHFDALQKISAMFELYSDKLHGKINIVIYKGDKDKVSIWDTKNFR